MREGLSSEAANKYCGTLEHEIYGSQKPKYALTDQMSEQMTEEQGQGANVQVPQAEFAEILSAIVNAIDGIESGNLGDPEYQQLLRAKEIGGQVANIEE